jgi:exopolysaccharide biosynthesis WecB/TagA/CpsF family protein
MPIEGERVQQRRELLGLWFDTLSADELVDRLREVRQDTPFAYVVTPNVDHVVRLSTSQDSIRATELRHAYRDARYCVCDSRILQRLGRLAGVRLPLIAGSDLTVRLFRDVIGKGDKIGVIGANDKAIAALRERYPSIDFEHHKPPMQMLEKPEAMNTAVRFACEHSFRFLFIAVGSPQQEILARRIAGANASGGYAFCIGAGIDFVVEQQQRAPRLVQKLGLEWAHRLAGDPRRLWRRYLVDGPRIVPLFINWLGERNRR